MTEFRMTWTAHVKLWWARLFMWANRYDHGWVDGYNACRSGGDQGYMTLKKMRQS